MLALAGLFVLVSATGSFMSLAGVVLLGRDSSCLSCRWCGQTR